MLRNIVVVFILKYMYCISHQYDNQFLNIYGKHNMTHEVIIDHIRKQERTDRQSLHEQDVAITKAKCTIHCGLSITNVL